MSGCNIWQQWEMMQLIYLLSSVPVIFFFFFFLLFIYFFINSSQDSCQHLIYFIYLFLFIDIYVFIHLSKHWIQKLVLRSWQYPCTCFFLKQQIQVYSQMTFWEIANLNSVQLNTELLKRKKLLSPRLILRTLKLSPFSMKWRSCPAEVRLYINFNLFIFILL